LAKSLRVGLDPIDGLTIHRLGYRDGGRRRPVLHRASLAEMVVPYGDPSANQYLAQLIRCGRGGHRPKDHFADTWLRLSRRDHLKANRNTGEYNEWIVRL
jgi:hypothetical protein